MHKRSARPAAKPTGPSTGGKGTGGPVLGRGRFRRRRAVLAAASACVLALAGCTPPASGPSSPPSRTAAVPEEPGPGMGQSHGTSEGRPATPPAQAASEAPPEEDAPAGPEADAQAGSAEPAPDASSSGATATLELSPEDLAALGLDGIDLENMTLDDLASDAPNPLAGCIQCHTDVGDAFEGSRHAKEDILCTDCHGPSEGHLADENNEVKPDERFAREDVDRLCSDCHDCSRPFPRVWPDETPLDRRHVCTDCHGSHTLVRNPEGRAELGWGRRRPPSVAWLSRAGFPSTCR